MNVDICHVTGVDQQLNRVREDCFQLKVVCLRFNREEIVPTVIFVRCVEMEPISVRLDVIRVILVQKHLFTIGKERP